MWPCHFHGIMFCNFNQPLDRWKSNVEEFGYMFDGCKSFNQSLQKWKISVFADADNIFANCGDDLLRTYPKLKDNLNLRDWESNFYRFKPTKKATF